MMARRDYYDDPAAPPANSIVPAVTAVVTDRDDQVLLIHRTDNDRWALPGGGIELVPPRDPRALADTIESLLSDDRRLTALRRAARDTVSREFTWDRCGSETVEAYREVLDG